MSDLAHKQGQLPPDDGFGDAGGEPHPNQQQQQHDVATEQHGGAYPSREPAMSANLDHGMQVPQQGSAGYAMPEQSHQPAADDVPGSAYGHEDPLAGGAHAGHADTGYQDQPALQNPSQQYAQPGADQQGVGAAGYEDGGYEQGPADPLQQGGSADPHAPQGSEVAFQGEAMEPSAPVASPDEDWVPPQPASAVAAPAQPVSADEVGAKPLPRINIQAFCEEQGTADLLQNASQDRRLAKTHVSVQMGGLEAAAHYYRNAPTPNLIIIESMHDRDAMLMDIDRLASVCDSGTKVVVIGHINDVMLYRQLLQRGVSEYLVMPVGVSQLMQCLSTLYNDPASDPLGSILAFVGAKGGVGSSTVCHNTAWSISQGIQSDVVIADLDLPFGTAGLDFNQDPVQGIADALFSPERLDDVLLDRLLSRCSDYLSLFAAPGTLDRPYDLNASSCDVVMDVLRKNVPYVAADVPHVWTEWAQQVLVQADRVIITAIPDLANLRNTKNLIDKLSAARPNDLQPILVLNQLGVPKRPEISIKDFASAVETEPTCVIEFDTQLFGTAANNGQMIEEVSAKSKAAEQFQLLAQALTDRTEAKSESQSILAPILEKFSLGGQGKKSKKKAGKT